MAGGGEVDDDRRATDPRPGPGPDDAPRAWGESNSSASGSLSPDEPALDASAPQGFATDPRMASPGGGLTQATVRAALFPEALPPRLGKYRVVRELGRGGLGVVYLAEDAELGRSVAIKVLRNSGHSGTQGRSHMLREARALAALSHPNVVHVYEIGSHDRGLFVAMEYVPGQTLREWLRTHDLSWRALVARLVASGRGLAAAHRAGLIHRDYKPENVLIGEDGRPRVVDFGLARFATAAASTSERTSASETTHVEQSAAGGIAGTLAYMAPEQVLGGPIDARCDQFSFCVVLFEALHGRRPFANQAAERTLEAIAAADLVVPEAGHTWPDSLEAIVRRGLARAPERRFENMDVLLAALEQELGRPPWARRRATVGGAIALLAVAVAGLAWVVVGRTAAELPTQTPPLAQGTRADAAARHEGAPAPSLKLTVLTKTPGSGLDAVAIDPMQRRIAYTSKGAVWVRDREGGAPRQLKLPFQATGQLSFSRNDGALLLTDTSTLWRVGTVGGAPERIASGVTPSTFLAESATGEIAGVSETVLWRVGPGRERPLRTWPLREHPSGIAWSPDGALLALRSWPPGAAYEVLRIFDAQGDLWLEAQLETSVHEGIAWFNTNKLAVLGGEEREVFVRCFAVDGDRRTLRRDPRPERTLTMDSAVLRSLASTRQGALLLETRSVQRDVWVGPIDRVGIGELTRVAAKVDAGNRYPAWETNSRLAFVSDLNLSPAVLRYDLVAGALLPPLPPQGAVVAMDQAGIGRGRVTVVSPPGDRSGATQAIYTENGVIQLDLAVPDDAITSLRCFGGTWCAALRGAGRRRRFDILDLGSDRLTRGADCPAELLCTPGNFSVGSERRVLVPNISRDQLHLLDPRTGQYAPTPHKVPDGAALQSAAQWPRSQDVIATLILDTPLSGDPYVVARLGPDGSYRPLWSAQDTWLIGPVLSPDARHVALTGIEFRSEGALLEGVAQQCAGSETIKGPGSAELVDATRDVATPRTSP